DMGFEYEPRMVRAWRRSAVTSALTFAGAAQKILDAERFDVVHAQGYACRRADVVTAHVCNTARYAGSPARTLAKRVFPALVIPRERAFFKNANGSEIIAVSRALAVDLETHY